MLYNNKEPLSRAVRTTAPLEGEPLARTEQLAKLEFEYLQGTGFLSCFVGRIAAPTRYDGRYTKLLERSALL